MPTFYIKGVYDRPGDTVEITGENYHHLSKSMRLKTGEKFQLNDEAGNELICRAHEIDSECIKAEILDSRPSAVRFQFKVKVYQSIPKGNKLDDIIENSTALGVSEIIPVLSKRCEHLPSAEKFAKRAERRQKIADAASKQSGRAMPAICRDALSFNAAVGEAAKCDLSFIAYEKENSLSLKAFLQAEKSKRQALPSSLAFMIGPEGGFSEEEIALAEAAGITPVGLGPFIFRSELASTAVLAALIYEYLL